MINKTESLILRRVAEVGQKHICDVMGKDPSTVSRMFSGKLGIPINELEDLLSALGLTLIDQNLAEVNLSKEEYQALLTLARKGLERMENLDE